MSLKKLLDLKDRVAIVTGGSRGLGLQIAEGLGEMGARIAISSRKQGELDEATDHLKRQGIDVFALAMDIGKVENGPILADKVLDHFGRIDILINNAGTGWGAPAEDHPLDGWNKVMNVNVNGLWTLTQAVGKKAMIPKRYGRIVNIASISGLQGQHRDLIQTLAYNTSKGAVVNLTRTLAAEWGHYGITVNAIAPGLFPTKISASWSGKVEKDVSTFIPLEKLGGPEDLKGAALLFASDAGGHITGQILAVDGGQTVI